jgi:hypothetical protein
MYLTTVCYLLVFFFFWQNLRYLSTMEVTYVSTEWSYLNDCISEQYTKFRQVVVILSDTWAEFSFLSCIDRTTNVPIDSQIELIENGVQKNLKPYTQHIQRAFLANTSWILSEKYGDAVNWHDLCCSYLVCNCIDDPSRLKLVLDLLNLIGKRFFISLHLL